MRGVRLVIFDYDKTVAGHIHFHFSSISFYVKKILPYKTAQQTHKTRFHLFGIFKMH